MEEWLRSTVHVYTVAPKVILTNSALVAEDAHHRDSSMISARGVIAIVAVAACIIFTSGCAGTRQMHHAPQELNTSPEAARISVQRSRAFPGSASSLEVLDGSTEIGKLGLGGQLEWARHPGPITLRVTGGGGYKTVRDVIEPGGTRAYDVTVGFTPPSTGYVIDTIVTPRQPVADDAEFRFASAKAEGKESAMRPFLTGRFAAEAAKHIESLRYKKALKAKTENALESFLAQFPDGDLHSEAEDRLRKLRFDEVQSSGSIDGYRRFLTHYSQGADVDEVEKLIEKQAFDTRAEAALELLISRFPQGGRIDEARKTLREVRFLGARTANTAAAYGEFLRQYSAGQDIDEIRRLLKKLAFNAKSETALELFLSHFPHGSPADDARAMLRDVRFESAKKAGTTDAYALFVRQYPEGADSEKLRKGLVELRRREDSLKLGEIALRMAPEAYIGYSAGFGGGTLRSQGLIVECRDSFENDIQIFTKLLEAGADPRLVRIKGYEAPARRGMMVSFGTPGTVVGTEEGGLTLWEFFSAIGTNSVIQGKLNEGSLRSYMDISRRLKEAKDKGSPP